VRLPRHRLHPAVLAWADAHARDRRIWGVALSGGADSVALLLLLWAHWPKTRARLRCLHFDHALRGAASKGDARFCRLVAEGLGVRFVSESWGRPKGPRSASEASARAARLSFLHKHASILWLGHHQDDVAETMLMRLARGSGTGGLSAPRPVHAHGGGQVHLRPLLTLRKAELTAALAACGIPWREDATNASPDFFRNRIRAEVLPAWERAAQRDAVAGAARSRELLEEDDTALEQWLEQARPFARNGDLLLGRLRAVPRAVRRRALQRWLQTAPWPIDISRQAFETLLASAERGAPTRHSLARELFGEIKAGRLFFRRGKRPGKIQRPVN